MTKSALRKLVEQSVSHKVMLHLSDGRKLPIAHPDFVLIPPTGDPIETDFIVVQPDAPTAFDVIALPEVVSASAVRRPRKSPSKS
jgi:hypothetical protein